jgi:tRNA A37 methylthiotransferase MiaB
MSIQCTFCADGTSLVSKVNQFSVERVRAEIRYIAERVSGSVKSLHIADLNFGMYKRDAEICDALGETKRQYNYPLYIDTATGKNSKERIIDAIKKLDGVLPMIMSVQSMTPDVLRNIKRDNIKLQDFLELKPAIRRAKLPTSSEIKRAQDDIKLPTLEIPKSGVAQPLLMSRSLLNIAKRSLLRLMLSCVGLASKHAAG